MKHHRLLLPIAFPLILLGLFFTTLQTKASPSATFTVNSTVDAVDANPGNGVCETAVTGQCTLRAAVMEANVLAGEDTINLPNGTYILTITGADEDLASTGDLDITEDLNILGNEMSLTIVDGNYNDRIFHIHVGLVTISDITIQNGVNTNSSGTGGGGIFVDRDGGINLNTVTIANNQSTGLGTFASVSGGGIFSRGMVTITNSIINNNESTNGYGGGIYNETNLVIDGTIISGNIAGNRGGGIYAAGLTLKDSTIAGNTLTKDGSDGGGLYVAGSGPFIVYPLLIENSTIQNNSVQTGKGGGIFIGANAGLTISGTKIISNSTNTLNGNTGTRGGGIFNESSRTVTIIDTTISENISDSNGGGIYNDPSDGIGDMILNRVTLNQNVAQGQGAGIYNAGTLSLSNVTIANNLADGFSNEEGGGIYQNGMSLTLLNSTIVGNQAYYGGGIFQVSGSVTLENTILANNLALGPIMPGDPDTHNCVGSISSNGHNLEDGVDCNFASIGDLTNINPFLIPTITDDGIYIYKPTSKSAVIDAGSNTNCPTIDQRLVNRPIDGDNIGNAVCDIGSIEYDPSQDFSFFTFLPTILK